MSGTSNVVQLDDGTYIATLLPFRESRGSIRQLERDRIMKVRDKINELISRSSWHFQTDQEELDLGEPYQKLSSKIFLLKDDWSVDETFCYWETHPIQIDCLIILNLLLLFYLRDELQENGIDLEEMRPAMVINVSCGLVQTGLHYLIEAIASPLVPIGDLDHQEEGRPAAWARMLLLLLRTFWMVRLCLSTIESRTKKSGYGLTGGECHLHW